MRSIWNYIVLLFISPRNKSTNSCNSLKNRTCVIVVSRFSSKFTEIFRKARDDWVFSQIKYCEIGDVFQFHKEIRWNLRTCNRTRNLERISIHYVSMFNFKAFTAQLIRHTFFANDQETRVMTCVVFIGKAQYLYVES